MPALEAEIMQTVCDDQLADSHPAVHVSCRTGGTNFESNSVYTICSVGKVSWFEEKLQFLPMETVSHFSGSQLGGVLIVTCNAGQSSEDD